MGNRTPRELKFFQQSNSCVNDEPKQVLEQDLPITPNGQARITHNRLRHHLHHLGKEHVVRAASTKFATKGEGLEFGDLLEGPFKLVDTEKQARNLLKYHQKRKNLYTSRRSKPQQYFASKEDAAKYERKITPFDPTGYKRDNKGNTIIINNNNLLSEEELLLELELLERLEEEKAETYLQAMTAVAQAPIGLHNIRLRLKVTNPYECYYNRTINTAPIPVGPRDKKKHKRMPKKLEHRVGDRKITYLLYLNGTCVICIECSKHSFPLRTDWDVTKLMGFVGEIRDTLRCWLRDNTSNVLVPELDHWVLDHVDICKDIPVVQKLELTVPKVQLKSADYVYREYVKKLDNRNTIFRAEEARKFEGGVEVQKGIESILKSPEGIVRGAITP